jgi:hypothetical protein
LPALEIYWRANYSFKKLPIISFWARDIYCF